MNNLLNIGSLSHTAYNYAPHSHPCWEVIYYYDGEGYNITDSRKIPFSDGTIICQPPHVLHEDRSATGYKNIFFCVEDFNIPHSGVLILQDNKTKDFYYILKQLYEKHYSMKNYSASITNALLNVLYEYIMEFINSTHDNVYVNLLESCIINNISNPEFSVTEAMESIAISPDYLRRLFRSYTGVSPIEHLQNIRISYAKQMLKNSSLPIKNIALMSGYSDPYYFSRLFKKLTGQSPFFFRTGRLPEDDEQSEAY